MAKKKLINKARQSLMVWAQGKDKKPVGTLVPKFEFIILDDAAYMPQTVELIRRKQLLERELDTAPKRAYTKKEDKITNEKGEN